MTPTAMRTTIILTYAGTLPLVIAAIGTAIGAFPNTDTAYITTTYSAIIISFLAGIHWACYLFFSTRCPRNLLFTSNIIALLAWLSIFIPLQPLGTLLQILCFLYLLVLDYKLQLCGVLPVWFYHLRCNATVIVVLLLCAIIVQQ